MSDSASRKTDMQDSNLMQSQPEISDRQPTIGDLSAIQSEMEENHSVSPSVGDINVDVINNSDVLSDITLLEEAFAELEDGINDSEPDLGDMESKLVVEAEPEEELDIPVLNSSIELPSEITASEIPAPADNSDPSIPVLEQRATEMSDMLAPTANTEAVEPDSSESMGLGELEIPTLASTDIPEQTSDMPVSEQLPVSQAMSATESAAEVSMESEIEPEIEIPESSNIENASPEIDEISAMAPLAEETESPESASVVTTFDAADVSALGTMSESDILENTAESEKIWTEDTPTEETPTEDISTFTMSELDAVEQEQRDEIEKAEAKNTNETTFTTLAEKFDSTSQPIVESNDDNDVFTSDPISASIEEKIAIASGDKTVTGFNEIPLANENLSKVETELAPGFVEELGLSQVDPSGNSLIAAEEPSLNGDSVNSHFNMSIPFDLHAQLSKKIDDLVLDATMSLTKELEQQLSTQLESLLGSAVESVLPRLIDQMTNELRTEVKGRVKHQLPIIVNDVLGKTRLR